MKYRRSTYRASTSYGSYGASRETKMLSFGSHTIPLESFPSLNYEQLLHFARVQNTPDKCDIEEIIARVAENSKRPPLGRIPKISKRTNSNTQKKHKDTPKSLHNKDNKITKEIHSVKKVDLKEKIGRKIESMEVEDLQEHIQELIAAKEEIDRKLAEFDQKNGKKI